MNYRERWKQDTPHLELRVIIGSALGSLLNGQDGTVDPQRALSQIKERLEELQAILEVPHIDLKRWPLDAYDPAFGDDKECACGHEYDRHFDSYDAMSPIGCKYCDCDVWHEPS